MRKLMKPKVYPKDGTARTVTKFAWLPVYVHDSELNIYLIWLESYTVIQRWSSAGYDSSAGWIDMSCRLLQSNK